MKSRYIYGREAKPDEKVVPLSDAEAEITDLERRNNVGSQSIIAYQQSMQDFRAKVRDLEEEISRLRGEQLPQRQDSLLDQLASLIPLANRTGCYDAADFLRDFVEKLRK